MNKTKICKTCGEEKDIALFVKNKKCKDGHEGQCKECRKEYKKQYRKENRDEILEKRKQYYQENRDKILNQNRQYNQEHKEKMKEYNKQWYQENRDEILQRRKQYHEENPHISFNDKIKRRSKEEQQGKGINKEQWFEMMNYFDWSCAYSNERLKSTIDTFGRTIDHIVALKNGGLNEPWNCIPMRKGYNSSKNGKVNSLDWYLKQDYYSEDRLNKIIQWQIYSYNKWATEDDEDLILIVDII